MTRKEIKDPVTGKKAVMYANLKFCADCRLIFMFAEPGEDQILPQRGL